MNERGEEGGGRPGVCYYPPRVCIWCCPPSFFLSLSASLDVAGEQFQDHSNTGGGGGGNIESMLSTSATSGGDGRWGCGGMHRENSHSIQPRLPFHFPLTFAFFPSPSPASLSSLLTAVIVSFSLSKNIAVLPRCKGWMGRGGRDFPDMRAAFSSARRGEAGILGEIRCLNDSGARGRG